MRKRKKVKIIAPEAEMIAVARRPFRFKKVNSKKLRANGMKKAPSIMPIVEIRMPARSKFRGLEIW